VNITFQVCSGCVKLPEMTDM